MPAHRRRDMTTMQYTLRDEFGKETMVRALRCVQHHYSDVYEIQFEPPSAETGTFALKIILSDKDEFSLHRKLYEELPHCILPVLPWCRVLVKKKWKRCKVTPWAKPCVVPLPRKHVSYQQVDQILGRLVKQRLAREDCTQDWRRAYNQLVYTDPSSGVERVIFHDFGHSASVN